MRVSSSHTPAVESWDSFSRFKYNGWVRGGEGEGHGPDVRPLDPQVEWGRGATGKTPGSFPLEVSQ